MKSIQKFGLSVFIAIPLFLFTLACEQPFKAGLGTVVDTRPPTVTLIKPSVGDYIWGKTEFRGIAEDDYKLDKVMIRVTNHPNPPPPAVRYNDYQDYVKTSMVSSSDGRWNITIDTTVFPEGDFKIQLIVYDSVGKFTETDEIAFFVKNQPPAITVASPYIPRAIPGREKEEGGEAGGPHLNYGFISAAKNPPPANGVGFRRQVDKGSFLAGTIRDDEDIYTGQATDGHYPPQYRIWKIPSEGEAGVLPSEAAVPWKAFNSEELLMLGIGSYQFIYELPDEIGYWGFELRAQSKDGRTNFRYPRGYYPADINWDADTDFTRENRYVLLYIRSPRELPRLSLYGQHDIFGRFESGLYQEINAPKPHEYVDDITVDKNGKFSIWVQATHSDGISTAEIYWEKDDRSERGRLIWDWEPETWKTAINLWSSWIENQYVDEQSLYSYWGYRDNNFEHGTTTRNFIFTFDPVKDNKVPAGYNGGGRSKIQRFRPSVTNEAWNELKRNGALPENTADFEDMWEGASGVKGWIPNGVYNFEVYTHSEFRTPVPVPLTFTIRVDRKPPDVEITNIEGAYEQGGAAATVNGVVRPIVLISDSESFDSGLKFGESASYFGNNNYEQFFLLIGGRTNHIAQRDALNTYLAANPNWWPASFTAGNTIDIPGITVVTSDKVTNGSFKLKTSPIYVDEPDGIGPYTTEPDALPNGTYWLYVFARDNAFNVGHNTPHQLEVDHATDKPVIKPRDLEETVIYANDEGKEHFIDDENKQIIRNRLGAGSPVRFTISDDDGFALSDVTVRIAHTIIDLNSRLTDDDYKVVDLSGMDNYSGIRKGDQQINITQNQLYRALHPVSAGDTTDYILPDGIYKIEVVVKDALSAKLRMNDADANPLTVTATVEFYFVIETESPILEITSPNGGVSGGSVGTGDKLEGYVSDYNGPIRLTKAELHQRTLNGPLVSSFQFLQADLRRKGEITDNWVYDFSVDLNLGPNPGGTYYLLLEFTDRFGSTRGKTLIYTVDESPPIVSLRVPISTFVREGEDVILTPSGISPSPEDKRILANGVGRFVILATDDVAVTGAKWWFLPHDIIMHPDDPTYNYEYTNSSYPSGGLTDRFADSGYYQYVNMVGLDDGRYNLWVMATDNAGNVGIITQCSNIPGVGTVSGPQPVFVLKEEDKPYFGKNGIPNDPLNPPSIKPSLGEARSRTGLAIAGTIFDDDGFLSDSTTLKVYLRTGSAGDVPPAAGSTNYHGNYYVDSSLNLSSYGYTEPKNVTGITVNSRNPNTGEYSFTFNIPVESPAYFPNTLTQDREYQYILEAQDTNTGKFAANGMSDTTRVSRRRHFTFVLDVWEPIVNIEHPNGGQYGRTAITEFYLKGTIADANLAKDVSGNYYIKFKVGSDTTIYTVPLGTGAGNGYITAITNENYNVVDASGNSAALTGVPTVHFEIPAGVIVPMIDFMTMNDGSLTLTVMAYDDSGKSSTKSVSFQKDTNPPNISFNDIDKVILPLPDDYWGRTPENKKKWLVENPQPPLTVLDYQPGSQPPPLKGSFSDDFSNIEIGATLQYCIDGGTWTEFPISALIGLGIVDNNDSGSKTISWSIPLSALQEGVHVVQFQVLDISGNPFSENAAGAPSLADAVYFGFRLNSRLPTVTFKPLEYSVYGDMPSSEVFILEGTASSPNLKDVRVNIRYTDERNMPRIPPNNGGFSKLLATLPASEWVFTDPILEVLNWKVTISKDDLMIAANNAAGQTEGTYEITVVSIDLSGTESNDKQQNFTMDISATVNSSLPVSRFDFGDNEQTGEDRGPTWWIANQTRKDSRTVLMGSNPKIGGRISDEYSALQKAGRQIRRFNYDSGKWEYRDFIAGEWQETTTPNEDNFWQDIPEVKDKTNYPLNWELKAADSGLGTLEYGYYSIRLRARDSAYVNGNDTIWNETPTSRTDGNPSYSGYVYFFYSADNAANFTITTPDLENKTTMNTPGGNLLLAGTASDPGGYGNRFEKLEVTVESDKLSQPLAYNTLFYAFDAAAPDNIDKIWDWTVLSLPVNLFNGCPDGAYRLWFTLTDLSGRTTRFVRNVTLDNTAPEGAFDLPSALASPFSTTPAGIPAYYTASEIILGGNPVVISGMANDKGSGVKGVWYHLGYIGNGTNPNPQTSLSFPTREQINTSFNNNARVEGRNAWFKYAEYDGNTPQNGTVKPVDSFLFTGDDPYSWALNLTSEEARVAFKDFANVKDGYVFTGDGAEDTRYNQQGGPWLVQRIDNTYQNNLQMAVPIGLYSLPFYIRVEDFAGNVAYYCRDIWIYPNGDIPSSTFINPTGSGGGNVPINEARGGMVSVEGVASDNISVRDVIYRVWVDGSRSEDARPAVNALLVGAVGGIITNTTNEADQALMNLVAGKGISTEGWYRATLDSEGAVSTPWSFRINEDDEYLDYIKTLGFNGLEQSGGEKDTIRVYVEVLAFDNDNNMSFGEDVDNPQPYARIFFLKSTAPKISGWKISDQGSLTSFNDFTQGTVRSSQFAVRANLDGRGREIGSIAVRRSGETSGWVTVYGTGAQTLPGISFDPNPFTQTTAITYRFDSTRNADGGGFASIQQGNWAHSGGKFTLDIRLRDNASPPGQDEYSFEIGIDNFAPLADTGIGGGDKKSYMTPKKVAGSNATFMGRVFDYYGNTGYTTGDNPQQPPYRGIQEVRAWFTREVNGTTYYYNMNTGAVQTNPSTTGIDAFIGHEAEIFYNTDATGALLPVTRIAAPSAGASQTVRYPTPAFTGGEWHAEDNSNGWIRVINETTANRMLNKMMWQSSTNSDILWTFDADTTQLPDGWITLNYVVIDKAGNASYFTQRTVVMNKFPEIAEVTLYTNNRGIGAAFEYNKGNDSESYSLTTLSAGALDKGYLNSGFISKNMNVGFEVVPRTGNYNWPLHYRVQYVTRHKIPLTGANLANLAAKNFAGLNMDGGGTLGNEGINLFTIPDRPDSIIDKNTWALLGARSEKPGTHFVFTASTADIDGINYTDEFVWGYRAIRITEHLNVSELDAIGAPDELRFVNSPDFGGSGIPDSLGSRPDLPDGALTNGSNNNPDATAFFLIKVWDSVDPESSKEDDMLYDAVVVGMNVYINDNTPPKIRLYDLNPYTETAVYGNNIGNGVQNTLNAAANPSGIGLNALRGGLYNLGTEGAVIKSGYIDPRDGSTALAPLQQDEYSGLWVHQSANGYDANPSDTIPLAGDERDKVAGKILIRGVAWDDQLIKNIRITLGTKENTLLVYNESEGKMMPNIPDVWVFEELHWKTGHTVEWAYLWDTETYNNGLPANDVSITVNVTDKNSTGGGTLGNSTVTLTGENNSAAANTLDNMNKFHNTISVDIVPYITGFKRQSKYATSRSRQGWYSFYRGETGVSVLGYNLGQNGGSRTIEFNDGNTAITVNPAFNSDNTKTFKVPAYTFNVPSIGGSKISLNVGTAEAHNNGSDHTLKSWNREYHIKTPGSELWTNKPYAHVWRSANDSATPATYFARSEGSSSPGFALQYVTATSGAVGGNFLDNNTWANGSNFPMGTAGLLHGAWATFKNDSFYYSRNDVTAADGRTLLGIAAEPYMHTAIDYYNNTGALVNNLNLNVAATYWGDGQSILKLKNRMYVGNNNSGGFDATANTGTPSIAWFNTNASAATNRWQNTRVRKADANTGDNDVNAGRAFVVSYDAPYKRLLFVNQTARETNQTAINGKEMYIDGGTGTQNLGQMPNNNGTTNVGSTSGIAGETPSSRAGEWAAVDYTTAGYPVIAYYDEANGTLRLARANTNNPATGNNFTRSYVFPQGHALRTGSGTYVSMRIDKNNRLHLAFCNSNRNTVVYATAPLTNVNNGFPTIGTFEFFIVDTVVKGGAWTDIQVDNDGHPWIVYADSTRTGNYDGARIAYRTNPANGFERPLTDTVTGGSIQGWEAVSVPSDYVVNDDRLNIAVWPPNDRSGNNGTAGALALGTASPQGGWNAAVGYGSDMFRIAYFFKPSETVMNSFK